MSSFKPFTTTLPKPTTADVERIQNSTGSMGRELVKILYNSEDPTDGRRQLRVIYNWASLNPSDARSLLPKLDLIAAVLGQRADAPTLVLIKAVVFAGYISQGSEMKGTHPLAEGCRTLAAIFLAFDTYERPLAGKPRRECPELRTEYERVLVSLFEIDPDLSSSTRGARFKRAAGLKTIDTGALTTKIEMLSWQASRVEDAYLGTVGQEPNTKLYLERAKGLRKQVAGLDKEADAYREQFKEACADDVEDNVTWNLYSSLMDTKREEANDMREEYRRLEALALARSGGRGW